MANTEQQTLTKHLERALKALQLSSNEWERLKIKDQKMLQTDRQGKLFGLIESQIIDLRKRIVPIS